MMALNRYRLRHLVQDKHRGAILANTLLSKPDRLIGLILFANNVVNFLAAAVATIIGIRLLGDYGAAVAPLIIAIIFIIFAEMIPKTFAAINPEKVAFPSSYVLMPLSYICYPIVALLSKISHRLLLPFGINTQNIKNSPLGQEELRNIVYEAGATISSNHQDMLLNILDIDKVIVNDIMITRNDLIAIDLDAPIADILEQLMYCQHTRLVVYRGNIDNIVGLLHTRRALRLFGNQSELTVEALEKICDEPFYLPESTSLYIQMLEFQKNKQRVGLVVDEYGVLQGMITLDDILEEIIGGFTTDLQTFSHDFKAQEDGSFFINGSATIRDINKQLDWKLPISGPKTINGLILQHLGNIPTAGTSIRVEDHTFEIIQVMHNAVKKVKATALSEKFKVDDNL